MAQQNQTPLYNLSPKTRSSTCTQPPLYYIPGSTATCPQCHHLWVESILEDTATLVKEVRSKTNPRCMLGSKLASGPDCRHSQLLHPFWCSFNHPVPSTHQVCERWTHHEGRRNWHQSEPSQWLKNKRMQQFGSQIHVKHNTAFLKWNVCLRLSIRGWARLPEPHSIAPGGPKLILSWSSLGHTENHDLENTGETLSFQLITSLTLKSALYQHQTTKDKLFGQF